MASTTGSSPRGSSGASPATCADCRPCRRRSPPCRGSRRWQTVRQPRRPYRCHRAVPERRRQSGPVRSGVESDRAKEQPEEQRGDPECDRSTAGRVAQHGCHGGKRQNHQREVVGCRQPERDLHQERGGEGQSDRPDRAGDEGADRGRRQRLGATASCAPWRCLRRPSSSIRPRRACSTGWRSSSRRIVHRSRCRRT